MEKTSGIAPLEELWYFRHPEGKTNFIDRYRDGVLEMGFVELPSDKYMRDKFRNFALYPEKDKPRHFLIEINSTIPMIRLTLQESQTIEGRYPFEYWGLFNKEVVKNMIYIHDIFE